MDNSDKAFLKTADVLIIIFSICQLILECFQLWKRKLAYLLDHENWIEVTMFVISVAFVSYHLRSAADCFCSTPYTWALGIIAVFLGWMNLIIFLRQVPLTGITISIMFNIFTTFMKLLFFATLLIFAFALPFYMLLLMPVS